MCQSTAVGCSVYKWSSGLAAATFDIELTPQGVVECTRAGKAIHGSVQTCTVGEFRQCWGITRSICVTEVHTLLWSSSCSHVRFNILPFTLMMEPILIPPYCSRFCTTSSTGIYDWPSMYNLQAWIICRCSSLAGAKRSVAYTLTGPTLASAPRGAAAAKCFLWVWFFTLLVSNFTRPRIFPSGVNKFCLRE